MTRSKDGIAAQDRRNAVLQYLKFRRDPEAAVTIETLRDYLNRKHGWSFSWKSYSRDLTSEIKGLSATSDRPARYFLPRDYNPQFLLNIADQDVQMLAMALAHLRGTAPATLGPLVSLCETSLMSRLPDDLAKEFERFNSQLMVQYSLSGKPRAKVDQILRELLIAFRNGVTFQCKYDSQNLARTQSEKEKLRTFGPICFEVSDSRLSIIAEDRDEVLKKKDGSNRYKRLIVTRMKDVAVTLDRYQAPPKSAIAAWENSFAGVGGNNDKPVPVLIEGDAQLGRYFSEREIHPSQKVTQLSEDRYRVEFKMPLSRPLLRLLGGFSGSLSQVKPQSLKTSLISIWSRGLQALENRD